MKFTCLYLCFSSKTHSSKSTISVKDKEVCVSLTCDFNTHIEKKLMRNLLTFQLLNNFCFVSEEASAVI